ncbi:RusA family crossover junction endodeoxyribonuclease [Actinomadura formosensis]|uniref:RusA family crossover junction endodeoxyribonuclease n=1 Tax=Actinomadura formosensis TaxID=60706 RepID=UPI003D8CF85F
MTPVTFTVFGAPAGQGNLKRGGGGKLRHANGIELEGWRTLVRGAAARATGYHGLVVFGKRRTCVHCGTDRAAHGLFRGAVALDAIVAIARPPSVTRPYPTSRRHSDWDHHARALCDALTGLMYPDDSQVVDGHVRQVYVGGPGCPLPEPGALITVSEVGDA